MQDMGPTLTRALSGSPRFYFLTGTPRDGLHIIAKQILELVNFALPILDNALLGIFVIVFKEASIDLFVRIEVELVVI